MVEKNVALIAYRGERAQIEMAAMYGVSQQLWSCWENGISTPALSIMKRIEDDSGIPMEYMFCNAFCDYKSKKSYLKCSKAGRF